MDAINYVSDNYIMGGTDQYVFSPNDSVTRGMAIYVLFRVSGDTGTYTHPFTDVLPNQYFYNAVGWAYQNGLVGGTSPTTFSPAATITKQQLTAILYIFADYLGLDRILDEEISQASDYANVSSYAVNAFRWAYSYGIYTRTSNTDAINPTATVDRKNLALMVSRFRTHAEGINFSRDSFSFSNGYPNFVSVGNKYLMSQDDWNILMNVAQEYGINTTISYLSNRAWKGSCYGMAISTALDYIGKIDLNGNCCNSVATIHDIPKLTLTSDPRHLTTTDFRYSNLAITKTESKINLYQSSWFIKPIRQWAVYIDADTGLRELVAGQQHGGIGVFSYLKPTNSGHAVNVYGKPEVITNGYRIMAYDNRNPMMPCCIEIDTSGTDWTGTFVKGASNYEAISTCKYENDFDVYDIMDIDGLYNDSPNEEIMNDYCLLQICTTGAFTVENMENEILTWSGSEIGGDMLTYRQDFVPNGENNPVDFFFVVPNSDSFTCTVGSEDTIDCFFVTANTGSDGVIAEDYPNTTIQGITINYIDTDPYAFIIP